MLEGRCCTSYWHGGLADLGFVIDDHLDDSIEDVLGGTDSGINRESLWKKIVDELLLIVNAAPNAPYAERVNDIATPE